MHFVGVQEALCIDFAFHQIFLCPTVDACLPGAPFSIHFSVPCTFLNLHGASGVSVVASGEAVYQTWLSFLWPGEGAILMPQ